MRAGFPIYDNAFHPGRSSSLITTYPGFTRVRASARLLTTINPNIAILNADRAEIFKVQIYSRASASQRSPPIKEVLQL
jgi:hypothetical protein